MEPSSSMVHLAMAAFFGASLMAISALFIHKRSVDQILERLIEVRRRKAVFRGRGLMGGEVEVAEEEIGLEVYGGDDNEEFDLQDVDDDEEEERDIRGQVWGVQGKSGVEENLDMNLIPSYGISSSVPNVGGFSNDWLEDDSNNHGLSSSLDKSHLPLLQRYLRNSDGCSSNLLENTVSSNGQAKELNIGDATPSQQNNDNSDSKVTVQKSPALPAGHENHNILQDQKSRVAACERKAILDLPANVELDMPSTGAGGDDVSAETILPLKAAIPEEEEVQRLLRDCLELREAYVYKEQVAPWNKPVDATATGKIEDPFHFSPVEKTYHDFRMEDGVIHVYASKDDTEELFPVPSATQFFTDMHQVLKVASNGNVNSACYHRLRFLEE